MLPMLRMATWNVEFGRRLDMVVEAAASLPALDVIALQELSVHGGRDDAEAIAHRLGPSWRFVQVMAQVVSGRPQANGLIWNSTRFDLIGVGAIDLPIPSGRLLRSLPPSRRNAVVAEGWLGRRRVRLYAVHLDVFGISHKHAQLAHVLSDASGRDPVDLAVIAGDMNTYGIAGRPRWAELRRLAQAANFQELTAGIGWTHRALGVRQKLDAIFVAPPTRTYRASRVLVTGSDHLPVLAEIG
jgi:endonuclease/exonuclease/phosphatase family metal-dependent hydrolase